MPAAAVDTAEALKDMLASASLSQACEIDRNWANWNLELNNQDDGRLRVDVCVVTTHQQVTVIARGGDRPKLAYSVPVDIAIRQKLDVNHSVDDRGKLPNTLVDDLVLFTQEIHEFLVNKRLEEHEAAI